MRILRGQCIALFKLNECLYLILFPKVQYIILSCLMVTAQSFYLPGIAPIDYQKGDPLEVKVRGKHSNIV